MKIDRFYPLRGVVLVCLCWICILAQAGCSVVGKTVSVDKRIMLSETQDGKGEFKSGQLTVNYNYRLQGNILDLQGEIYFNWGADSLDVRVLMLDSSGTVLDQKIAYSSGFRTMERSHKAKKFDAKVSAPSGTSGISFDYSSKDRSSRR